VLGAVSVSAMSAGPSLSSAASFTQPYPFTGAPAGTAGWTTLDIPSPNPWYTSSIGTGGLQMAPTGNGGLVYDNGYRSGFQINAPAGATITRAVLGGVDALQADRQRTRINLLPQPSTGQLDGTEPWAKATDVDGDTLTGTITLTPQPGFTAATGLQVRHFPVACGDPNLGQPPCAPVSAATTAHARAQSVTLTLDDPSAPTATLSGPAGGWTNATSATVTAGGQDPQSGISRLSLTVKSGSSTRRPVIGTWNQDTTGNSIPGRATTRSGPSTLTLPRSGTVTVTSVARNGAGTESTSTPITIRVDRTAPTITWPRKLEGGQSATVRDSESGLANLTARVGSKTVTTSCAAGAKQCKVKIPTTADGTLRITTTDQAGNDTDGQRTVIPRPRGGGPGGGGSKGGAKKPPTRKPGSKKPTASYCKKHPSAKACGPERGSLKPPRVSDSRGRLKKRLDGAKRKIAKSPFDVKCGGWNMGSFRYVHKPQVEKFLARNWSWTYRMSFTGPCPPEGSYDVEVKRKTGPGAPRVSATGVGTVLGKQREPVNTTFFCSRNSDALQNYRVTVRFTMGGTGAVARASGGSPGTKDPERPEVHGDLFHSPWFEQRLKCPSRVLRRTYEYKAWQESSRFNPATGKLRSAAGDPGGAASRLLRETLKKAKKLPQSGPSNGWDAHHIVPSHEPDPAIRIVQAAAFQCHVRPAAVRNGVFLRNSKLRRGSEAFRKLPRGLKRRTYHADTQTSAYGQQLKKTLVGAGVMDRIGNCTADYQRFYAALDAINRRLRRGTFIPGSGR